MFHKAPSYFLWTLSALFGETALIDALTAVVRAAGKRGAPCGGPGTVSALISSVTFKLSLEATAAAAGHVRRALGCWGRISSARSPGPGRRPREGWPRAAGRGPGRAGRERAGPGRGPCWSISKDGVGKRSSPQPASWGCANGKRKPRLIQNAKSSQGVCRNLRVHLAGLDSVDQNVTPTSRSLFLSGKRLSLPLA